MNFPKCPHSAMFVWWHECFKTEYLLRILKTERRDHSEIIVMLCPMILDNNKTYISRIFDDKNVFIVCDVEGKLNEWLKLF